MLDYKVGRVVEAKWRTTRDRERENRTKKDAQRNEPG